MRAEVAEEKAVQQNGPLVVEHPEEEEDRRGRAQAELGEAQHPGARVEQHDAHGLEAEHAARDDAHRGDAQREPAMQARRRPRAARAPSGARDDAPVVARKPGSPLPINRSGDCGHNACLLHICQRHRAELNERPFTIMTTAEDNHPLLPPGIELSGAEAPALRDGDRVVRPRGLSRGLDPRHRHRARPTAERYLLPRGEQAGVCFSSWRCSDTKRTSKRSASALMDAGADPHDQLRAVVVTPRRRPPHLSVDGAADQSRIARAHARAAAHSARRSAPRPSRSSSTCSTGACAWTRSRSTTRFSRPRQSARWVSVYPSGGNLGAPVPPSRLSSATWRLALKLVA